VKWSALEVAEVPPGVDTVTSTVPALPAGDVTVTEVVLLTTTPVAVLAPKWTAVALVRAVPVIVTLVPPAVDPDVGLTLVTVGAAM
jgi:hypothetical protein